MTLKEALIATVEILNSINIPMGLKKQIADPLGLAKDNLDYIISNMKDEPTEQKQEAEDEDV